MEAQGLVIFLLVFSCSFTHSEKIRYDDHKLYSVTIQNEAQLKMMRDMGKTPNSGVSRLLIKVLYRNVKKQFHSILRCTNLFYSNRSLEWNTIFYFQYHMLGYPAKVRNDVSILVPPNMDKNFTKMVSENKLKTSVLSENFQKWVTSPLINTFWHKFSKFSQTCGLGKAQIVFIRWIWLDIVSHNRGDIQVARWNCRDSKRYCQHCGWRYIARGKTNQGSSYQI